MQSLNQSKTLYHSPKSRNISSEEHNLKIKSHFTYIKKNVSGDFPGCNNELFVVAALNPLLHKFQHFEYLSDFLSYDILEDFFLKFLVPSCIYQYALFCLSLIVF